MRLNILHRSQLQPLKTLRKRGKLSRLMGHSSVEVTEEYLKDFRVRSARQEQDKFSPVASIGLLGKRRKSEKKDKGTGGMLT